MPITNRRVFLIHAAACMTLPAAAQSMTAVAKVDEKDPQAAALGYVSDTTKADVKKYP